MRIPIFKTVGLLGVVGVIGSMTVHAGGLKGVQKTKQDKPSKQPAAQTVIDLTKTSPLLSIESGKSKSGTPKAKMFDIPHHDKAQAWVAKVANGNPRTPAIVKQHVVVGSASGNKIHAFDVWSGKHQWTSTSDDAGISSMASDRDSVYYTTYSCTLERIRVTTGKRDWVKWISPTVHAGADVAGDSVVTAYKARNHGYSVASHDTENGSAKWFHKTGSDVLTAPVIAGKRVLFTDKSGALTSLSTKSGKLQWSFNAGAVSQPIVTKYGVLLTTRAPTANRETGKAVEPKRTEVKKDDKKRSRETVVRKRKAKTQPEYEDEIGKTIAAVSGRRVALLDPFKAPKGIERQGSGVTEHAGLEFQGIRPGVNDDQAIFAHDGTITCTSLKDSTVTWQTRIKTHAGDVFTTPVAEDGLVFIGSRFGYLMALDERDGSIVWSYCFKGQSFRSMPAAGDYRLAITTARGELLVIPTGTDIDRKKSGKSMPISDELKAAIAKRLAGIKAAGDVNAPKGRELQKAKARVAQWKKDAGEDRANEVVPIKPEGAVEDYGDDGRPTPSDTATPSKGEWDRREDRKADRRGDGYKKKPYRRDE